MQTRLNKAISDSGICSRREADRLIENGKVLVNGKIASVGTKVFPKDQIRVNGHLLEERDETVYLAFNKPVGVTCTTDLSERDNIVAYVNYPSRIFNVGRLDKDSEGLIFLTNDGDIVNKILRSGNKHEKEYVVTVNKSITEEFEKKMATGVPILGVVTKKCKFVKETDTRFRITLVQGLNRQIRRMCEALGYEVEKLKRVRIMNITLEGLPTGDWRMFTQQEIDEMNKSLEESVGVEKSTPKKEASKKASGQKKQAAKAPSHSGTTKHSNKSSSPKPSKKSVGGRNKNTNSSFGNKTSRSKRRR